MAYEHLIGGGVNQVVRIGDCIHRTSSGNSAFVHTLLSHFEEMEWAGAPRFLGIDPEGREILSYIDGLVPHNSTEPSSFQEDAALVSLARLVREFHDLTAGTALAGSEEVVCHNDLSPKNTVYRRTETGYSPIALIDWDIAAPGKRIHDVAHVCWQWLSLGPEINDVDLAAHQIALIADAYGLDDTDSLVPTILWWQDRCWRGIEAQAIAGNPAMQRFVDNGVAAAIRAAQSWTDHNREPLSRALQHGTGERVT